MSTLTRREPSFIDRNRLYTVKGFHAASGISETRLREARRIGVDIPSIDVGRRRFYRGADVIAFIERLAAVEG